ncbi:Maternal protein tudor [Trichinella sp. T6]|nr:Maternal protein tudor [Trichinella sp. T6]KRX80113.1 Maternal protein tudor [Trichinella sp. T6]
MERASDIPYDYEIATSYKSQHDFLNFDTFGRSIFSYMRLQAAVSNWISPNNFHVNFLIFKSKQKELEKSMNGFYKEFSHLPNSIIINPALGMPVAVLGNSLWHRGLIASKLDTLLRIFFVDVGSHSVVELNKVRPLYWQFNELPPLAFKCYLQGFDLSELNEYLMNIFDKVMKVGKVFDCEVTNWEDSSFLPVNMYEENNGRDVIDVHFSSYFKKQQMSLEQRQRDLERRKKQQDSDDEIDTDESM